MGSPAGSAKPQELILAAAACPLPDSPMAAAAGRYRILGGDDHTALLGRGTYGKVRVAWDKEGQKLVAIKEQPSDCKHAAREMQFFQMMAAQPHPHVVSLFDAFVNGSVLYPGAAFMLNS